MVLGDDVDVGKSSAELAVRTMLSQRPPAVRFAVICLEVGGEALALADKR